MATKKQKRERMQARWEAEEAERRERGQHYLRLSQEQRRREHADAEAARKERAIAKSKRLAKEHQEEKERLARAEEAAKASKPGLHRNADGLPTTRPKKQWKGKKAYAKAAQQQAS